MNEREREAVDSLTNAAISMAASNRLLYRSLATKINIVLAALRQQQGEFICRKCLLRQDAPTTDAEVDF